MVKYAATKKQIRSTKLRVYSNEIRAIDLFCGAGGLTRGLESAGVKVAAGVDIDPSCAYPYTANNKAAFLLKSIEELAGADLADELSGAAFRLLAGCAPCQPFSTYNQGKPSSEDKRWNLLKHFARLVKEVSPDFVTMENVPLLEKQVVFKKFVIALKVDGYFVFHKVVNCADYGVPQNRQRLVLLASKHGQIEMMGPAVKVDEHKTVRDAIKGLPPLRAGQICSNDPLHQASHLSALNLRRIRASKAGGTWRDWNRNLVAACHKRGSGKTYPGVYGRMVWDEPAPTMTTQFFGFGNGRFGHPQQNRGLSLREGAILQSFPPDYDFIPEGQPIHKKTIGRALSR